MKRIFTTLYTLAAVALAAVAQSRFTSNTEMYSFGQIEWKQPVTAQYTITNTGDQPLVLTEVEPDCACSVAQWTKSPIAPGAKGVVNVTFDAEALGHFQKSVAIHTNAQPHLVYLKFNGEVVRAIKDFTRTHPYLIGQIRIDKNSLDFPDMQHGEHPTMHIGVVNLSERPYEPVLMHLPPYLQMEAKPNVLQKGEKGIITLTLNSEKLTDLGLTQASVYLARFAGDKVGDENEIPVSAVLLPDFSGMTATEKANAPVIDLSAKEIDMSDVLAKKSKARQDIAITNKGHAPLQINKLQVFHPAVGVNLKKSVLQPGESTRLRVTVEKKNIGKKRRHLRLLIITNDPMQPKVEINIKAKQ
ncbi:DUF1573 domain-containing protein [Bacteroides helcogenes]|uniref:HYDIN/VesB/CFA65-like Ig-like domain-containing protein n=1 Tax=Bacteroides helcogenes (strain ATCC 35417 / DSM 20613 / JCM 6297 / CCUG 15421 / P 36-108) TaxID=693979 RepID=E6STX8_BACT6|nr:DUF1573 domain-containing protein [Bacteroides helcogenes]ADV43279.1 protein of unknown function DUF1573 [Bacteroides helcogenes P 36-108]MDY5238618.1 DUF1573 domain-containing protein [Bacteroides helcogenes]